MSPLAACPPKEDEPLSHHRDVDVFLSRIVIYGTSFQVFPACDKNSDMVFLIFLAKLG